MARDIAEATIKEGDLLVYFTPRTGLGWGKVLEVILYKSRTDGCDYTRVKIQGVYKKPGGFNEYMSSKGTINITEDYSWVVPWSTPLPDEVKKLFNKS